MKKNIKNNAAMLMMAVAVMGGMTSCEEHSDEFDGSLRVGNILLADNGISQKRTLLVPVRSRTSRRFT